MKGQDTVMLRATKYAKAWKWTGLAVSQFIAPFFDFVTQYPQYIFPWIMIFNKLIRALVSPTELDHWVDIQGYAQLVIDDLDEKGTKK